MDCIAYNQTTNLDIQTECKGNVCHVTNMAEFEPLICQIKILTSVIHNISYLKKWQETIIEFY
jgi:hypothetical protein